MKLAISDIVTAFNKEGVIGTKVIIPQEDFITTLETTVLLTDNLQEDQVPGQHFVKCPRGMNEMVSCGTGKHTGNAEDYIVRMHRGEPCLFLKRELAAPCTGLACVIYTRQAYLDDPQVTPERVEALPEDATHVLVAVLGFSDSPKPEVSSHRFVRNLAGGNNEYDMLARAQAEYEKAEGADRFDSLLQREVELMVKRAKAVVEYEQTWCTVAD